MKPGSKDAAQIALMQVMDPQRGEFIVTSREPLVERERNPRGVRHINKTAQDHMPKAKRPRVAEWQRQQELRRQGR